MKLFSILLFVTIANTTLAQTQMPPRCTYKGNQSQVNSYDAEGKTPLYYEISTRNPDCVQRLLKMGADFDLPVDKSRHAIMHALRTDSDEMALLVATASNNLPVSVGLEAPGPFRLINIVSSGGFPRTLEFLTSKGADVNIPDGTGGEAIFHLSDSYRRDESTVFRTLDILVNNGANVNSVRNYFSTSWRRTLKDSTPLHVAIYSRNLITVKALVKHGADIDLSTGKGSPLHLALYRDSVEIFDFLLKAGANPFLLSPYDHNVLHNLVQIGTGDEDLRMSLLNSLIKIGIDVNGISKSGDTPLHLSVQVSFANSELLLKHGANVNVQNSEGDTPLLITRVPIMTKLLLEHGANPDIQNSKEGQTPLHRAVLGPTQIETMKVLANSCANPFLKDKEHRTPLEMARAIKRREHSKYFKEKYKEIVMYLVKYQREYKRNCKASNP